MKILLTGAAGGIGAAVARDLLEHGHAVRALDIAPLPDDLRGRVEMVWCDLSDRLGMMRAAQGCEAVAHLAAIPNPIRGDTGIFEANVLGTQYVLAAAEANGISRVVLASSCSSYGLAFARHEFEPDVLPISENTPQLPQDLYGLSKQLNEQTAAAYTRRCGMATTCLRITMVIDFQSPHRRWMRRGLERATEWKSRDFWCYVERRDAARAFRLALERVESGHHIVHIAARDILARATPRELIERHYPDLARFLDDFDATNGFLTTDRAEELFGFVAEIFWRDVTEFREDESK